MRPLRPERWLWYLALLGLVACQLPFGEPPGALLAPWPSPSVTPRLAPSSSPTATALISSSTPLEEPTPQTTPNPSWPMPPTVLPVRTVPWPTYTPTPLQAPWLEDLPYARIQILRPRVGSMEVSPIDFYAQIYRDVTPAIVHVELWSYWQDEARLLYRKVVRLYRPRDPRVRFLYLQEEIPFEIRPAQAWARLQVLARDTQGLPVSQQAVPLVLQRYGLDIAQVEQQLRPAVVLEQPADNQIFPREGTLTLQGVARYTTGLMEVLLYDRDQKRILLATTVPLGEPDPTGFAPFAYEWPYQFPTAFRGRLVFQLYAPRVPGVAYLESVDVRFR